MVLRFQLKAPRDMETAKAIDAGIADRCADIDVPSSVAAASSRRTQLRAMQYDNIVHSRRVTDSSYFSRAFIANEDF